MRIAVPLNVLQLDAVVTNNRVIAMPSFFT